MCTFRSIIARGMVDHAGVQARNWRRWVVAMAEGGVEVEGALGKDLPPAKGRASAEDLAQIEATLEDWALSRHHATPDLVRRLKSCLHEEFLLSLPEPNAKHFWPANPKGNSWRYLFRRQCFRVLGVHHWIPEGHPDGLPSTVDEFIRHKWWPDSNQRQPDGTGAGGST